MSILTLDHVSFAYNRHQTVLHDINLVIERGTNLGIVGESGSGKTTLLRLLLGLSEPSGGTISFDKTLLNIRDRALMRAYRRVVQMIFQDPYSSLDPRQKIRDIIAEPLQSLNIAGDHAAAIRAALTEVDLDQTALNRYPHEFSGGQRQRIAIARAIVARPDLVLADEAVSALDLSTRIKIVELLNHLADHITLVLVSHDLGVVAALCPKIVILERGRVVESGDTKQILAAPQHPYTQKLVASVPRMPV